MFCSYLERAGGWGDVKIVQSIYDDIAKIKRANKTNSDLTLRDSTLRDSTTAPAPSLRADRPPIKKKIMKKISTRLPLLTAGSQFGRNIPVLRVGERVFAPWCTMLQQSVAKVPHHRRRLVSAHEMPSARARNGIGGGTRANDRRARHRAPRRASRVSPASRI